MHIHFKEKLRSATNLITGVVTDTIGELGHEGVKQSWLFHHHLLGV